MAAATLIAITLERRREGIAGQTGLEGSESASGDASNPAIGEKIFLLGNVWPPAKLMPTKKAGWHPVYYKNVRNSFSSWVSSMFSCRPASVNSIVCLPCLESAERRQFTEHGAPTSKP